MSAGVPLDSRPQGPPPASRWCLAAALLALLLPAGCDDGPAAEDEIYIAVFMTLSGDDDPGYRDVLTWVQRNVNDAGGVAGRRLEYLFVDLADTGPETLQAYADYVAEQDWVVAVVGPEFSSDVRQIAPTLTAAGKPLVSPEATATEISPEPAGRDYLWRTVEADAAQAAVLASIVAASGARRVSLLTGEGTVYGEAFRQWFAEHGAALGLELAANDAVDLSPCGCAAATETALDATPAALVAIPSNVQESVCIVRTTRLRDAGNARPTPIFMADGAHFEAMIQALGRDAQGIEGTVPAADPGTGFDVAFETLYRRPTIAFGAQVYDAVMLLAYGLERSNGKGGPALAQALLEVAGGRGEPVGWDRHGIAQGLAALRRGELPDIRGASGPLEFHEGASSMDPLRTTYAHWRVEGRHFVNVAYYCTDPGSAPAPCLRGSSDR